MKKQITSRDDIKMIITSFYRQMIDDEIMFPFFEKFVVHNTLEKHLETITGFWEDIIFETTNYKENVIKKHQYINAFLNFQKKHFNLWLHYFSKTINANFYGQNADIMQQRAQSMATVMQIKLKI